MRTDMLEVIFEQPDQPSPAPSIGEPAPLSRRYHTKSRNGCFNCKKRRIKCNEALPVCGHCHEKALQCDYPPSRGSPQPPQSLLLSPTRQPSPSRHSTVESIHDTNYLLQLRAALAEDNTPDDSVIQEGHRRSDVFDLLQHFVTPTDCAWIGSPHTQQLIQDHVRRHAVRAPYLLCSALAFSAAHMLHVHPEENKYRVAAPYHYQHSLRRYYEKLSGALEREDADSLFVSCHLHAFLAFLNDTSAQDQKDGIDLGWVRSMRGARFITQSSQLVAGIHDGPFQAMMRLSARNWQEICRQEQMVTDAEASEDLRQLRSLEHLCHGLHPEQQTSFSQTLGMLRDLITIAPDPSAIGVFMIFVDRVPFTLIDLLEEADPLVLLMLAFWCALFSRIDDWWIAGSARAKCQRICNYVGSLHDPRYDAILLYLRSLA